MKPLRKNFGWLARFYNLTHESNPKSLQLSKITEYLASKFPLSEEMPEMKAGLYGGDVRSNTYVNPLGDEQTLLTELFKTKHADIFDTSKLNIYQRTVKLWENSIKDASRIARIYHSRMGLNPIRQEFLQATAEQLQPGQAYDLFSDKIPLMLRLIEYNPSLAATSALWSESYSGRFEIFEFLSKPTNQIAAAKIIDWRKIAIAMLDANIDHFTDHLYKVLNDELITIILDWHSQSASKQLLKRGWTQYLERHHNKLIDWVIRADAPPWTKALITKYLSPHSIEVRQHGSFPWLDLAEAGADLIPGEDRLSVMVFLLALGFMNLDQESYRLVAGSFESVYDAASTDSIPNHHWSYLDKLAPSEGRIFEWDKCRRLEEALISRIIKNKWPAELLLTAAVSPHILWNILKRAYNASQGRKLIWRLYDKIKDGKVKVRVEKRNVLEEFLQIDK
jgi:hypothetical protein